MHMPVLHAAPVWTVFWGELGPEGVRENWLTAIFHNGIFLPLAQHLNETDRDSDKCTKRMENLVTVSLGCCHLGRIKRATPTHSWKLGFDRPWEESGTWIDPESSWNGL